VLAWKWKDISHTVTRFRMLIDDKKKILKTETNRVKERMVKSWTNIKILFIIKPFITENKKFLDEIVDTSFKII